MPPSERFAPIAPVPTAPGDGGGVADAAEHAPPLDALAASAPPGDERWLRGSTHVHARPSGDSAEPVEGVIRWYEHHGYDFIALTDHNRISEVDGDTRGKVWVRAPPAGLIVLAGIELTHNPQGCQPPGHESGRCRIHVNALGVSARPEGKLEWAERTSLARVDMYQAALASARTLGGGVVQINHPSWYWGMTPELMAELARRGAGLVEIANVQFPTWNAGDKDHPSTEAIWDAALAAGVTLWGVASDDAHDYQPGGGGKYPAGGGWVVVKARRDPQAILDALAAGRFYASTGVALDRAEVDPVKRELVVEIAAGAPGRHAIAFVENGAVVASFDGRSARWPLPERGFVRAVVTRDDGKKAWVQPARR